MNANQVFSKKFFKFNVLKVGPQKLTFSKDEALRYSKVKYPVLGWSLHLMDRVQKRAKQSTGVWIRLSMRQRLLH